MPTDLPAQTNRIDEDVFPIALGFQAAADEVVGVDSHADDRELEALDQDGLAQAESLDGAAGQQQEPLTGYELVADMMRRQDEVLAQLDDLNDRIESTIKEVSAARKSEIEAFEAEAESESESDLDSEELASPADQPTDLRKAA